MKYLRQEGVKLLPWMGKGADVSIIENVWGILKNQVWDNRKKLKTKEAIWTYIKDYAFSEDMTEKIKDLYETIPRRVES